MREGQPSGTAQRVAAYRLGFARLPAPSGDPAADDRLARDVAGGLVFEPSERMSRRLEARTAFFDRAVVGALADGIRQVLAIGAGYDGRALRYARPGVRWFEVDHPATQADKQARLARLGIAAPHVTFIGADLRQAGLAAALAASGLRPDGASLMLCEGVAVYLDEPVLGALLGELRAAAGEGSRLAVSFATELQTAAGSARRARFEAAVRALGEPARNALTAAGADGLLTGAGWRAMAQPEQTRQAGFILARPA